MNPICSQVGFRFDLGGYFGYNINAFAFSKGDWHEILSKKRLRLEMASSRHGREAVAALAPAGHYLHQFGPRLFPG